ncbi:MAG: hypothetical protein KDA85_19120, partial [Planctomycetaceae bacterium]|nr:hypothetical protein [Planctomycetaceae bacterium]
LRFMKDNRLHGRLVVSFDWAQYALAALVEDTTVGFDGRFRTCYPQDVIDMTFDLTNGRDQRWRSRGDASGPVDPTRVLDFQTPNLVLLDRHLDAPGVSVMQQQPDWVLLYQDGISQLWGRSATYDSAGSDSYVPPALRQIHDRLPQGIAAWPGFPNRTGRHAFVTSRSVSSPTHDVASRNQSVISQTATQLDSQATSIQ